MSKQVSILGCGWLGLPLGEYLAKAGYEVKGSVTRPEGREELREKGVAPYVVKITDKEIAADDLAGFLSSEVLIVNFPPERRPDIEEYHPAQVRLLIKEVEKSAVSKVLFISSTSVYPDLNREVFEEDALQPTKGSGKALILAEQLLMASASFRTTVLRLAGLIGYDRMPGRFLAGKKNVENGDAPVNLIHQDDCIGVIAALLEQDVWGEVFNACADKHPLRKEYYIKAARAIGLEPPAFAAQAEVKFKIINADKLRRRLGYRFKHPDPLELLD